MNPSPISVDATWAALVAEASEPYRGSGRFALGFARGKLRNDPVFRHLLSQGLLAPGSRIVDIGCGQGLLASLLRAAQRRAQQGQWPGEWAAPPNGAQVHGIELVRQEVDRARAALGADADVVCGDMRHTPLPPCDAVVILDVLHYVNIADQDAVLERVRQALRPGGRLILRVGDASSTLGYRATWCIDAAVALARWGRVAPMYGRPLARWTEHLQALGFKLAATRPMSEGTPFANVLLVAEWPGPLNAGLDARSASIGSGDSSGSIDPPHAAVAHAVPADLVAQAAGAAAHAINHPPSGTARPA